MPQALLLEIRECFLQAANPADAAPMAAYMKKVALFFGLKAPQRRLVQRAFFAAGAALPAAEWKRLICALYHQPERELQYFAMEWLYHRRSAFNPETVLIINMMLTTKSWWDTVDFLACRCLGDWARRFPDVAKPVISRYIMADNFWLNRSAIIHQLHYGSKTDTALLAGCILPHAASKEFFLQKAIGWALRQYGRSDADWVKTFVANHQLAALSRREALKHL